MKLQIISNQQRDSSTSSVTEQVTSLSNPFKLLEAYSEEDKDSFIGRDEEKDQLYELVSKSNVVLVFGESGVGKTSLVRCGLSTRLSNTDWLDIWIRRGDDINICLRDQLHKALKSNTKKKLESENEVNNLLHSIFLDYFRPIYLIFDQFEELFILGNENERKTFFNDIEEILENKVACKIILIIREDCLGKLHEFEKLVPEIFQRRLKIDRMSRTNAIKVVTESAKLFNILLTVDNEGLKADEESIGNLIINACIDENGLVRLPYLQVFLHTLWRRAYNENRSKIIFYKDLVERTGKIGDVLKNFLIEKIQELQSNEEGKVWLFLKQFIKKETKEVIKRPVKESDFSLFSSEIVKKWLKHFVDNRILNHIDTGQYELAHESLVPIIDSFNIENIRPRLENPPLKDNPYKGLLSYDEMDNDKFYGRKEVINELYEKVRKSLIIPIVGASGSGKSSLIKAGLLPKLRKDGFYILPVIKPGKLPEIHINKIIESIKHTSTPNKYILYIDQYEELISQCEDEEKRRKFIVFIKDLIEQPKQFFDKELELKVLLSVRSDFESQVQTLYLGKYWPLGRFTVPPFSKDQIREIIVEPAYQAGLEFCPSSLVDIIIEAVTESSGVLPLLSYTLSEMYVTYKANRSTDGLLTQEDYDKLGGVIGGLRTRADAIYDSLDENGRRSMRNVFIRMLSLSAGELAGRRVGSTEFEYVDENETKRVYSILQSLIENGLVVSSKDDKGNAYYEPAHDSLVKSWGKLWIWINEDGKETLSIQSRLKEAVLSYKELGVLWDNNPRLELLDEKIKSTDNWLNKEETDFVLASIRKRNEQADIKKRNEEEKKLLNQKLLEEQQKANVLLQEKLTEDQKAALLLQEKLEEQKRHTALLKKSKRGLVIGIIILVILSVSSFTSLVKNYSQKQAERKLSDSLRIRTQSAKSQTEIAMSLLKENEKLLLKRDTLLDRIGKLANQYKDKNEKVEELLRINKDALSKSLIDKNIIKKKSDELSIQNEYKDSIIAENERFKARILLENEPFYRSNIDAASKQGYIDTLIAMKFDKKDSLQYNNFKSGLNKISEALKEVNKNPNTGLVVAKQAYDISQHKIIDSIGLSISNNNLFYKQKLKVNDTFRLSYKIGQSFLTALSKDKSHFAFTTPKGIRTGLYKNDSIYIDEKVLADHLSIQKKETSVDKYLQQRGLISLSYTNENHLVGVGDDYKIYRWEPNGKIPQIIYIPKSKDDTFYVSAISPDGKKLIRDYKNVFVKVQDVEHSSEETWPNAFDIKAGWVERLIYSPDSKKVILVNKHFKCWILDIENKITRQVKDSIIYNASFTPNGEYILFDSKDSLWMSDLAGNKIGKGIYKSYSRSSSQKLFISPNWQHLIVQSSNANRYFENINKNHTNDSLFYFNEVGKDSSRRDSSRNIPYIGNGSFDFLNDNSILSYNMPSSSNITLNLLKKHEHYDDFLEAYNSIRPYLTLEDKKDLRLEQLSENEIYEEAKKYYDQSLDYSLSPAAKKDNLMKAEALYNNLLSLNKENEDYLLTFKNINRRLFSIDSNFNTYSNQIKKIIEIEKNVLKKYSNDTSAYKYKYYKKVLSTDYGNLSYYLLLVDQPDFSSVIVTAKEGLALDSTNDFIYTNLALGYLLTKDTIKAKDVYKTYKGKYSKSLGISFTKAFLEDFDVLERRNVISENKKDIFEQSQKIKCWLKDEIGCYLE